MTATLQAPRPSVDAGRGRVTLPNVLRSEWIKLRSLRSTWFCLLIAAVFVVGLGALVTGLHAHRASQGQGDIINDPTNLSLSGVYLAQLAIGVFGVLVITGEYGTGQIRSSLAAVPRRLPVLIAKAVTFAALVWVVATAASFAAFIIGQAFLHKTNYATFSTPYALRAVFGAGLYLTVVGLLAVGLGFIVRNTAGAIASLVGALLILPLLANALPSPYSDDVTKWLPMPAGTQVFATVGSSNSATDASSNALSSWEGFGILGAYAAAALLLGAFLLRRRDG